MRVSQESQPQEMQDLDRRQRKTLLNNQPLFHSIINLSKMTKTSLPAKHILALQELLAHLPNCRTVRKIQGVENAMEDVIDKLVFRKLIITKTFRYLFRRKIC